MKKTPVLLFTAFTLFSLIVACAHYSKMAEVFRESARPVPRIWLVKTIELEERIPDADTEKKLPEILDMIAGKYHIAVVPEKAALKPGDSYAVLNLWIKEQPYTRSLDQYNSITGLLSLSSPDSGETLVRAFYSEESQESIRSFQRLYAILDELVRQLAPFAGK